AAHVPLTQTQSRLSNHDGVRSRSGRACGHRPLLPSRLVASRFVRQNETEIVRKNQRLEGPAGLRSIEYSGDLRSNEGFVAVSRPIFGTRACQSRDLEHVKGGAQRQSLRRLESERRTQDHDLRLFTPGQGGTDRFNSGHLERSRKLP